MDEMVINEIVQRLNGDVGELCEVVQLLLQADPNWATSPSGRDVIGHWFSDQELQGYRASWDNWNSLRASPTGLGWNGCAGLPCSPLAARLSILIHHERLSEAE